MVDACPPKSSSDKLRFTVNMLVSTLGRLGRSEKINCCVDGHTSIVWTYRKFENETWTSSIPGIYKFSISNMTINFYSVKKINGGFYNCTAYGKNNESISNVTQLGIGSSQENPDLIITNTSLKSDFIEQEDVQLCCTFFAVRITLKIFKCIQSIWSYKRFLNNKFDDIGLSTECSNGTLRENKFWWESTFIPEENGRVNVTLKTCIQFKNLQLNDSGYYQCFFRQEMTQKEFTYYLEITPKINKLAIYIGSISAVSMISIILIIFIWIFYYNLIIAYKKVFGKKSPKCSVDVLLLYDDQDKFSLIVALDISEILSGNGLSTYIHDRDMKYGAETKEDYLSVINDSGIILYFVRLPCFDNEMFLFCLQNSIKFKDRTIFVYFPSRTFILKSLKWDEGKKQIYPFLKSANYNIWKTKYQSDLFKRKRFINWILSNLTHLD